jgi:hypothetical protein
MKPILTTQQIIWMKRAGLYESKLEQLKENFGDDHDFHSLKPHHSYKTDDGHNIDVHIFNNPNGRHAVFYNKNLDSITKLVHWSNPTTMPLKQELEKAGHDEDSELNESVGAEMKADSAGKIAEHSTALHLINHMHKQNGTTGSAQHQKDAKPHQEAITKLSQGKDPEEVKTRINHGKSMAAAIVQHVKTRHGPEAKISAVAHTSKAGDISRFTNGEHKDGQENPSDVSVAVTNSDSSDDKKKKHFEGYSLKSSKKSSTITAKNPSIHMDKILDHPTRKLDTERISRTGLKKVHSEMGHGDKSAAERGRMLDKEREVEASKRKPGEKKQFTPTESKANEKAKPVKDDISKEFHDHLHHLLNNTGPEGHHMVGRMLQHHLTASTSMPWSKVHAKGQKEDKITSTVTSGSESPLQKIFKNKKSKYAVTRSGARVTIHHVKPDGSHTPLAHYSPKTKSNAFKSDVHGWNVLPASVH